MLLARLNLLQLIVCESKVFCYEIVCSFMAGNASEVGPFSNRTCEDLSVRQCIYISVRTCMLNAEEKEWENMIIYNV